jgi:hypothetical protein
MDVAKALVKDLPEMISASFDGTTVETTLL